MPDRDTHQRPGRLAETPGQIPALGWKDVLRRSWGEISENNIFLAAGGVTYAMLVALFPGLAALVSLYGLAMDSGQIQVQMNALAGTLPDQALHLLEDELRQLTSARHGALGLGAITGILVALWSASRGMSGLMSALDIAYQEKERRGFLRFNLIALLLTFGAILGGILVFMLVAALPSVVSFLGLTGGRKWLLLLIRWPILIVAIGVGLAIVYRYGPDRERPRWRWVSPGAECATALWILVSVGFNVYVANFSTYDKTYGALGGAVILLTWLYISSLCVLVGAVINAQAELQTRAGTPTAEPTSMGHPR